MIASQLVELAKGQADGAHALGIAQIVDQRSIEDTDHLQAEEDGKGGKGPVRGLFADPGSVHGNPSLDVPTARSSKAPARCLAHCGFV